MRFLRTDNCSRAKREGLTTRHLKPLPSFTHDISGKRSAAGGLANLKLSLWSGRAGGSSLPSRAELHRGLVARSVRSGKSADVSFTLDISGKRQRSRGLD